MKIKNLKYNLMAVATALTLTGCSCNANYETDELLNAIESLEEEVLSLEEDNEQLKEEKRDLQVSFDVENLSNKIKQQFNGFDANYYDSDNSIYIIVSNYTSDDFKLSDEFYNNFNLLLTLGYPCHLEIACLGDEIDFSRIKLNNVNKLDFVWCRKDFNYDTFTDYSYQSIKLAGVPFDVSKKLIDNSSDNKIDVSYYPYPYSYEEKNFEFVKYLIDNNICLGNFNMISYSANQELYHLLGSLNADGINLTDYSELSEVDSKVNINDNVNVVYESSYVKKK